MKIAMLAPIAWRTPPRHYGPWEQTASLLTEGLVERGMDVTLFATGDSKTRAKLASVVPRGYEEDKTLVPKVVECLHISQVFEQGLEFDLIHNHLDYLPLSYSGLTTTPVLTTIHGFSSPKILPVYEKYNQKTFYVAISRADRRPELAYVETIHHGIDLHHFTFREKPGDYLLFFGRIHPEKGVKECIEIARKTGKRLVIAGIVQDESYFNQHIKPFLNTPDIVYAGPAGPDRRDGLLGGALALLHPIHFNEPFGLSVVEAMACGTPVVAINRGSMPEVIADRETGFLVKDVREMAEAVSRLDRIDRSNCRKWVETRFTAQRMVQDYIRVYERILSANRRETHRPWGFYEILSDKPDHKVKRITVYPGHRLSLQRHFHRSEHWQAIRGRGIITRNQEQVELAPGSSMDIPVETWHRIQNRGTENFILIETQTGDYFGEDDIERQEDDYGRTKRTDCHAV